MTCRDFERGWNELLDARGMCELERALGDHAADCPACRQVATRYQLLHRALGAWSGARPAAPVGLADRILAAAQSSASTRSRAGMRTARPFWRIGLPLATAAAAVIALVFVRSAIDGPRLDRRTTAPAALANNPPGGAISHSDPGSGHVSADTRALDTALADATAATWDLARSASEPAARISLHVLDVATEPQSGSIDDGSSSFSVSVSSYVPAAPDSAAAAAMLRQMGDSLASSVGPLSNTARHAFGFLLGPPPAKPEVRQIPPAAKGA
jgi:hypothetical protein